MNKMLFLGMSLRGFQKRSALNPWTKKAGPQYVAGIIQCLESLNGLKIQRKGEFVIFV